MFLFQHGHKSCRKGYVLIKLFVPYQEIQCEIGPVIDQLDRAKRNAALIVERTHSDDDKQLVMNTVATVDEQMNRIKSWFEEKKNQVGDSLDSWQTYIQMFNSMRNWNAKQNAFLNEPLKFATLTEGRAKLQEYTVCILAIICYR